MAYFPLFIELDQKRVLAVGAGAVGARRIEALVEFGADVTVVAVAPAQRVEQLADEGRLRLLRGPYEAYRERLWEKSGGSVPFFLVLSATGDRQVDREVTEDGRVFQAFVNCAGDKSLSGFYFPGLAREGCVTAGVIAEGSDHRLAKEMAGRIRDVLRTKD